MVSQKNHPLLEDYDNVKSQVTVAVPSLASHNDGADQKRWHAAQQPLNVNSFEQKQGLMEPGFAGYGVNAQSLANPALSKAREPLLRPVESVRPLTSDMKYPTVQALQPQTLMVPVPTTERARHSSSSTSPTRQPSVLARAALNAPDSVSGGGGGATWREPRDFKDFGYVSEGAGRNLGEFSRGSLHRLSNSTRDGGFPRGQIQALNSVPASPTVRSTSGRNPVQAQHLPYRPQIQRYQTSADVEEYKV